MIPEAQGRRCVASAVLHARPLESGPWMPSPARMQVSRPLGAALLPSAFSFLPLPRRGLLSVGRYEESGFPQ